MRARAGINNRRGAWAEDLALAFVIEQGLREVSRNYSCRHGEIDLILDDHDTLVFAEVRYRAAGALVSALQSISGAKQRRVIASAEHWLQRHCPNDQPACRFDVLAVTGAPGQAQVEWLRDAFQA